MYTPLHHLHLAEEDADVVAEAVVEVVTVKVDTVKVDTVKVDSVKVDTVAETAPTPELQRPLVPPLLWKAQTNNQLHK